MLNDYCHESRPGVHHQSSPSRFLLDSIPFTPHTCPSSQPQLFPIITDYLYHPLPPICLVRLCMYVLYVLCDPSTFGLFSLDTSTVLPSVVSHSVFCFVSCLLAFSFFCLLAYLFFARWTFCLLKRVFPAVGHRPLFYGGFSHRPHDNYM